MSDAEEDRRSETRSRDRPVVALLASGSEAEAIAGATLRARDHGYEVLVVADPRRDADAVRFADQLDAPVIELEAVASDVQERVRVRAREMGYPGVIYQAAPAKPIDFEGSEEALRESSEYLTTARIAPALDTSPAILVGLPAYNEEASIGDVVTEASPHADEVLVVDDGSTDETAQEAREAGATVIEHEQNQGYGAALKTVFREAERSEADHLVILDADGQHDASDIPHLVEQQRETGSELVVGCRFGEDTETDLPVYRWVGLTVVNILTNLSLGVIRPSSRIRDTQNGFRCYSREAIRTLAQNDSIGDHMGASTDILHHAHAQDYEITEVETTVDYSVENASSRNPIQHGLTLVSNLLRTIEHERPIIILGIPGVALSFIGFGLGYWTFSNYLAHNELPLGLAVSSMFFTLSGVFTTFTAIILHALKQHLGGLENMNKT